MSDLIIGPKPKSAKKKPDGYHTFSVRVKQETVDKLDEISKRTGRTRNELIGIFLEYAANNCIVKDQDEP